MFLKSPKTSERIYWTKHSKAKLLQYQLSEKRVLRVLRKPDRIEEGIAPGTSAAMQIAGTKKHPTEVWLMYQIRSEKRKAKSAKQLRIISAWRYPGRSPIGKPPIPEDILEDLENILKED